MWEFFLLFFTFFNEMLHYVASYGLEHSNHTHVHMWEVSEVKSVWWSCWHLIGIWQGHLKRKSSCQMNALQWSKNMIFHSLVRPGLCSLADVRRTKNNCAAACREKLQSNELLKAKEHWLKSVCLIISFHQSKLWELVKVKWIRHHIMTS